MYHVTSDHLFIAELLVHLVKYFYTLIIIDRLLLLNVAIENDMYCMDYFTKLKHQRAVK